MKEMVIRKIVYKDLRKGYSYDTLHNINTIKEVLDKAYNFIEPYDVQDLKTQLYLFAAGSKRHGKECIDLMNKMHFRKK